MTSYLGSVALWGFGTIIGLIGLGTLIYWIVDEANEADETTEIVEGVAERSGSALVAIAAVLLTIGDQLVQLTADLVGMIDAPVVVGHLIGGLLGWLGLQGTISTRQFLLWFGVVTIVALIWRASMSRGRGI